MSATPSYIETYTKEELREEIEDLRARLAYRRRLCATYATEATELRDSLKSAQAERDRLRDELAQARADLDADLVEVPIQRTTPEPRPFRVGDRVRVAEGATKKGLVDGQPMKSLVQGMSGEVARIHTDGDLYVYTDGPCGYVSPEFCTLIEDGSEVVLPLPEGYTFTAPEANVPATSEPSTPAVVVTWPDGVVARYDRYPDDVEFQGGAWVIKDDANRVLAVVDGVRSVEVVR